MPNTQIITFWVDSQDTRVFYWYNALIDRLRLVFFMSVGCIMWILVLSRAGICMWRLGSTISCVSVWSCEYKKKNWLSTVGSLLWFGSGFLKLCVDFIHCLTHFSPNNVMVTIFILQSRGKVHYIGEATKIVQRHYGKIQHCGCNAGKSEGNEHQILCAAVITHYCIYSIKVVDSFNQIIQYTLSWEYNSWHKMLNDVINVWLVFKILLKITDRVTVWTRAYVDVGKNK